jgi:hypothetical protein
LECVPGNISKHGRLTLNDPQQLGTASRLVHTVDKKKEKKMDSIINQISLTLDAGAVRQIAERVAVVTDQYKAGEFDEGLKMIAYDQMTQEDNN